MDEVFGYLPPVANPPSKNLFLTLLKQARAYGLGVVLATQNPVDLDYKGLSNTGTWFIGRLQTERDKARVMEGLEGAGNDSFDRQAMERTLAGLGKRRFLLHNVHENEPVVFGTRWVLSYLAGPLTREHIRKLMGKVRARVSAAEKKQTKPERKSAGDAPAMPPDITQVYVPTYANDVVYYPRLLGAASIVFSSARYDIETERQATYTVELEDGPVDVDWDAAESLSTPVEQLQSEPRDGAGFAPVPGAAGNAKSYAAWQRDFKRWVRAGGNRHAVPQQALPPDVYG